jgi:hydrogenase expression/formation protein HypC
MITRGVAAVCVGIPGQIVQIVDTASDTALVEICGVRRAVNISCLTGEGLSHADCVGEWVLVHVGFAMSRLDEEEAIKTLELLQELGEMEYEREALQQAEV